MHGERAWQEIVVLMEDVSGIFVFGILKIRSELLDATKWLFERLLIAIINHCHYFIQTLFWNGGSMIFCLKTDNARGA